MLIWNQSKLTTAGKALLAKAQAGQTSIQITKAQTGSGSYSSGENLEGRTALKTPKQTFLPDSEQKYQRSRQYTYSEDCDHKQERNRNT